jgi:ABC-type branched-subunit amino acid transport system permease subunit
MNAASLLDLSFWVSIGITVAIFGILAAGFQLQFGYAGLMNFGHVAFMAIGAYTTAILIVHAGLSWPWAALGALVMSMVGGIVVVALSSRIRLEYFALATLAYSELVRYLIQNLSSVTGGTQGTPAMLGNQTVAEYGTAWRDMLTASRDWLTDVTGREIPVDLPMFGVSLVAFALVLGLLWHLVSSPWGLVTRAMREDELAFTARGYSVQKYRLWAVAISAGFAGLAGVLYAFYYLALYPSEFDSEFTLYAVLIVLLGGTARVAGVFVGETAIAPNTPVTSDFVS